MVWLLGQLQKNTTRAVFPPCPSAVCRNPPDFKVILSHFDFILVPWVTAGSQEGFEIVFQSFGVPSGDPWGVLWGAFFVLVATPGAEE